MDVLWVGVLGAPGIADLALDAVTPRPDGDPTAAPTGPVHRAPDYPDELASGAEIPAASVLAEPRPFQVGSRTFGIAEVEAWFVVVEDLGGGEWRQVTGAVHRHLPTVTVSEKGILVVSPGTSGFSEACDDTQVTVSVSIDGMEWTTSAIDDLGAVSEPTDSPTRKDCFQWGSQGGEVIGPAGFLVVRHLTRCGVNPANYPHFWFSSDGVDWQRVTIPDRMLGWPTDIPSPNSSDLAELDAPTAWGSPTAMSDGFAVEVERFVEEGQNYIETWESPDGLTWQQTGRRDGSLETS